MSESFVYKIKAGVITVFIQKNWAELLHSREILVTRQFFFISVRLYIHPQYVVLLDKLVNREFWGAVLF